jgi:hypothetical protein
VSPGARKPVPEGRIRPDWPASIAQWPSIPGGAAWWQYSPAYWLLILSVSLPLWFVAIPPLIDLPGHMARYHVLLDLADSPALQRGWDFHWAIIGNLGVELLIVPLGKMFGLHRAVWLVAAAVPVLLAWGMMRTARTIHGRIPGSALAALPFALAYPYQYGFINYWLGIALAFHAFAWWPRLAGIRRGLVFLVVGSGVWLCHAFAWGILGVLIGSFEIAAAWERQPNRWLDAIRIAVWRTVPLMAPILPMALWRSHAGGIGTSGFFQWHDKVGFFFDSLRDERGHLDLACMWAVLALIVVGLASRRLRADPRLATASILFLLLYLLLPFQLFGSIFADMRLAPIILMTAILALVPVKTLGWAERGIALVATAVLFVRLVTGASGFSADDREFKSHLAAADHIAPGARVVALLAVPCVQPWRPSRVKFLAALAVVERDAFVNTGFDTPGTELLIPKGGVGTPFTSQESMYVRDDLSCPADLRSVLARKIAEIPAKAFDYVWVIGFNPTTLPPYRSLTPLYSDESSVLFAISHKQPS